MDRLARSPRAIALLLGALSGLAHAPAYALPVLWIAFPGLVLVLSRGGRAAALAAGWAFGFGHFAVGLYWVGASFGPAGKGGWWLGGPAAMGLAAGLAAFPALAAFAARLAGKGLRLPVALAAAWTLAEALRSHVLTGFPWNLLGHAWAFSAETLQPAAWIGVLGLGALTAAAAVGPAYLLASRPRLALLAVLPLAAVLGAGALRGPAPEAPAGAPVVRVVQGNVPQEVKTGPDAVPESVGAHLNASLAPAEHPPHLMVWPETALPFDLAGEHELRGIILDAVPGEAWLAVGAFRAESGGLRNSLYFFDPEGRPAGAYDKVRLVPFGEFLPLAGSLPALAAPLGGGGLSAGEDPGPVALPGLPPFLVRICYEVIFAADTAGPDRPGWILNVTNDAWFGRTSGPFQHLAGARARAVEEGLPVVRAANTGISAVIGPRGRFLARLGLGEGGALDAPLPPSDPAPLHARTGDAPTLVLLLLALGASLAAPLLPRVRAARRPAD